MHRLQGTIANETKIVMFFKITVCSSAYECECTFFFFIFNKCLHVSVHAFASVHSRLTTIFVSRFHPMSLKKKRDSVRSYWNTTQHVLITCCVKRALQAISLAFKTLPLTQRFHPSKSRMQRNCRVILSYHKTNMYFSSSFCPWYFLSKSRT